MGITSAYPINRRWHAGHGYRGCPYFWKAIQKYGWDNFRHDILLQNETFEYASKAEKCLIAADHTNDPRFGYNLTIGGEGTCGRVITE